MKGILISRNTSIEMRKPVNRKTTPRNSPTKKPLVAPNRLAPLVMAGMRPPSAMRIVAGTRLWSRPVTRSRISVASEATTLTPIATGALSRLIANCDAG